MNLSHFRVIIGLLCLFAPFFSALSQDESEEAYEIEEVVVKEQVPAGEGAQISAETIEDFQARDLEDALRHSADVTVGGSQASAQKVYFRAVEDVNLNVTVDGARQSGYLFHHQGRLQVDPELLKRIEVAPATSALLGPGSLGGAIMMETKDPEDLLGVGESHGQMLKADYSTNAPGKGGAGAAYGKLGQNFSYLFYGAYRDLDAYKAGGGDEVPYTAARPNSILGKFVYAPGAHRLEMSYEAKENNAKRSLRNHFGDYGFNPPSRQDFSSDNLVISYDYISESPLFNPSAKIFHTNTLLRRYGDNDSETTWETTGIDARNLAIIEGGELTYGMDFNQDASFAKGEGDHNEELGKIFGLFFELDHEVYEDLNARLGLRYDHYALKSIEGAEIYQNYLSPSVGMNYQWNSRFSTGLSWGQAFKGATPMESLLIAGATGVENAGELRGTVAETLQASARYEKEKMKLSLALYQTQFEDTLQAERDRGTGIISRFNGERLVSKGATLKADFISDFFAYGAAFATNRIEYDGEALGYFAFDKGSSFGDRFNFYLNKSFFDRQFSARLNFLKTFELEDTPSGYSSQPGYEVVDLSLVWRFSTKTSLTLAVNNLFDQKYLAHGTPYIVAGDENTLYEPGRDVRIELKRYF